MGSNANRGKEEFKGDIKPGDNFTPDKKRNVERKLFFGVCWGVKKVGQRGGGVGKSKENRRKKSVQHSGGKGKKTSMCEQKWLPTARKKKKQIHGGLEGLVDAHKGDSKGVPEDAKTHSLSSWEL